MTRRNTHFMTKNPGFFQFMYNSGPVLAVFRHFSLAKSSVLACTLILFFPEHFEWFTSTVPQTVVKILLFFLKNGRTMVENRKEHRYKYWATCSSVRSFARTAHSFACSGLLASLAPSAALTRSLARSLRSLPRSWESV